MNFVFSQVLPILGLAVIYGLILWGLILLLRRSGIPSRMMVIVAFLVFAAVMGVWAALVWPLDSAALINLPASVFGHGLYGLSIRYLGDPGSPQAHDSIPWLLRVPQVYVLASIVFWGCLGLAVQMIGNYRNQIVSWFGGCCPGRAKARGKP